jgi:hypothetical protein
VPDSRRVFNGAKFGGRAVLLRRLLADQQVSPTDYRKPPTTNRKPATAGTTADG